MTLVRRVNNAPKEASDLIESLDQFYGFLSQVQNQLDEQVRDAKQCESAVFILRALEVCGRKLKPLNDLAKRSSKAVACQHRTTKILSSLKFAIRKDEIREYQDQLRNAKNELHLAISSNMWKFQ